MSTANSVAGNAVQVGMAPSRLGNGNLGWEQTTSTDLGLDVSLFRNRIQVNFDYYNNITDNLLFSVPVPYATGFQNYTANTGKIRNRGFEVDINSYNVQNKDFQWSTSLNLSKNKNVVLEMTSPILSKVSEVQMLTQTGGPVSQFYVLRTDGVLLPSDFNADGTPRVPVLTGQKAGSYKYVNANGDDIINSEDYVSYGNSLPDLIWGMTNTFKYKGFELRVLLQGQFGGDICWIGSRQFDSGSSGINIMKRWVHCYKPELAEDPLQGITGVDMSWDGKTPAMRFAMGSLDMSSDAIIYDATFLKIKNITLLYDLSSTILKQGLIKGAKIYFSADNVAMFDRYPGMTPEANNSSSAAYQMGVDYSTYPISRRFTLGMNLIF
jgi:hypothetical protein